MGYFSRFFVTASSERFVGIDVSKDTLDVHIRPDEIVCQFANSDEGISSLLGCLENLNPTLVVVEATGGYERAVVAALSVAKISLSLVNPKRARDFAKAWDTWPRPTGLTPGSCQSSPNASAPRCDRWRMRMP
jgi:hypothetical protein